MKKKLTQKKIFLSSRYNFVRPIRYKDLIRVGQKQDGGYVIGKKLLKNAKYLLSFGIGDNWSFEKDFIKYNRKVKLQIYDHTIDKTVFYKTILKYLRRFLTFRGNFKSIYDTFKIMQNYLKLKNFIDGKDITYYPKKISNKSNRNEKNIWEEVNGLNGKIVIKCDIEGDEYIIFSKIKKQINKVEMMVIEFHWVERNFKKFKKIILNLKKNFNIIHLHANNYSKYHPKKMPDFIEITFAKKSEKEQKIYSNILPRPFLDYPNNPYLPEYKLFFNSRK